MRQRQVGLRLDDLEQVNSPSASTQLFNFALEDAEDFEVELPTFKVRYHLLGYQTIQIVMDNQTDSNLPEPKKEETISVPPDTTHVIPSVTGFLVLYGKINNINEDGSIDATVENGYFGSVFANVRAVEVADGSATIQASMFLANANSKKDWTGIMSVTVLALQRVNSPD